MAPLATLEDFQARHGLLAEEDNGQVEALLVDASAFIRGEAGTGDADWAADDAAGDVEVPPVIRAVCVQVAYRAWANPDSIAREQIGDMSRTYRGNDQSDAMWLTANERRMIRKAANGTTIRSVPIETPFSGPAVGAEYDLSPGHGEGIGE
jgi:hypothetical protein